MLSVYSSVLHLQSFTLSHCGVGVGRRHVCVSHGHHCFTSGHFKSCTLKIGMTVQLRGISTDVFKLRSADLQIWFQFNQKGVTEGKHLHQCIMVVKKLEKLIDCAYGNQTGMKIPGRISFFSFVLSCPMHAISLRACLCHNFVSGPHLKPQYVVPFWHKSVRHCY